MHPPAQAAASRWRIFTTSAVPHWSRTKSITTSLTAPLRAYFKGVELLTDFSQRRAAGMAAQKSGTRAQPRGSGQDREDGLGRADGDARRSVWKNRKNATRAAANGSARAAPRPLAPTARTRRASASARTRAATRAPSKVWDQRAYQDYDDTQELGTRNIKVALRRLRKFAREGRAEELDLDDTIRKHGGQRRLPGHQDAPGAPQQREGAAADGRGRHHGRTHSRGWKNCFSAAKTEFKHLEFYYFHNCVYDFMWKNNRRRYAEKFDTWDIIRKYNKDYKLIFVGDATMSPYEILQPGGSVEYNNEEAGAKWLQRLIQRLPEVCLDQPRTPGRVAVPAKHQRHCQQLMQPAHVPADLARPGRRDAPPQQVTQHIAPGHLEYAGLSAQCRRSSMDRTSAS